MMPDRLLAPFAALVRRLTARIDYLALYACRVVAQNTDLTLELQPDDARIPSLSAVPIRHGLPGVTVRVAAGARVLLAFENGDPSKPVATLWDSASVEEIVFAGGTKKVAREDDEVSLGTFAYTPGVSLVWVPPGSVEPVPILPTPTPVTGRITGGNPKLKA